MPNLSDLIKFVTLTATQTLSNKTISGGAFSGDSNFDSNTLFVDASTGRVGVNTTSPASLLEVSDTTGATIRINSTKDGTWTAGQSFGALEWYSEDTSGSGVGVRASIEAQSSDTFGVNGKLAFKTNDGNTADPPAERMVIDEEGKVGIGTSTSSYTLDVVSTASSQWEVARIKNDTAGDGALLLFEHVDSPAGGYDIGPTGGSDGFAFRRDGSEQMRIDSSGNVGIGTSTPGALLEVSDTTGATIRINSTKNGSWTAGELFGALEWYGEDVSGSGAGVRASIEAQSAKTFGVNGMLVFKTLKSGSTLAENMVIDEDGNVGIGTNTPSYTLDVAGTLRGTGYIYATGSTSSTGLLTGGKTSPALGTEGCEVRGDGVIIATTDGQNCMALNRKTNDGSLVSLYQDGTVEGQITVSGTTVSYNNFMGAHYSELDVGNNPLELPRGTIVEATGNLVSQRHTRQQRLSKFKPSDTAASKAVYGVIDGPAYQDEGAPRYPGQKGFEGRNPVRRQYNIAAVGAGFIRIAAGATVNVGDLIESAGDGTGRVQADDVIRSSTVGKMTSADIVETYADGSTLRPCVLYCG